MTSAQAADKTPRPKNVHSVGLIGHRFMGKAHSHAYRTVGMFFDLEKSIELRTLCGVGSDLDTAAARYGFSQTELDWHRVIEDPEIEIIDICTHDALHEPIAIAAAYAGKHVICEKPLAIEAAAARRMLDAARSNGVRHLCNFTYRGLPTLRLAKELIDDGEIGEIYGLQASYLQDFCLSPQTPYQWRMDAKLAGAGILGDKGAHVLDLARWLCGEIKSVAAAGHTVIPVRLDADGISHTVETYDMATIQARFANGALGLFELSNVAAGRRNALLLEIRGSKGAIRFDLERLNELALYSERDERRTQGFRMIHATLPDHPFMGHWWPPGHSLGWEHTFVHQIYMFLRAIEQSEDNESNFEDGWRCQQLIDACAQAAQTGLWVSCE
ncbi:dehydrogenase [Clostridia bacterium]|nr:dehydrogenase [Clostridia bacterium]